MKRQRLGGTWWSCGAFGYFLWIAFTVAAAGAEAPGSAPDVASQSVVAGDSVTLLATGTADGAVRWQHNGVDIAGATGSSLSIANAQPSDAGSYQVIVTSAGGTAVGKAGILGVSTTNKVVGAGREIGIDIVHPAGYRFDQVLLTGQAAAVTADSGQVTRVSYIDPNDDIVQIEFSGPGTLDIVLDNTDPPAPPMKYNQPSVSYPKGRATLVVTGANEQTNLSIAALGRANTFDPTGTYNILLPPSAENDPMKNGSSLYTGEVATVYDGFADVALLAIQSANGRFGGVRTANTRYAGAMGLTGVLAPNVEFAGPVFVYDIDAMEAGSPVLVVGKANDLRIAGGDLHQTNGAPVALGGLAAPVFTLGVDAHGNTFSALANAGTFSPMGSVLMIIRSPENAAIYLGEGATLDVQVVGTSPVQYQWRKDESELTGRTGSSLTIADTKAADGGWYDVVVSNSAGMLDSADALLTVSPLTATVSNPVGARLSSSHSLYYDQYLGTRFQLSSALAVTAIDVDLTSANGRDLFAAIVRLSGPEAFPTASSTTGLSAMGEVVWSTLFNPGTIEGVVTPMRIPASAILPAGNYAVVFGAGLFGSPGGPSGFGGASGGVMNYGVVSGSDTISWVAPSSAWSGPEYDFIAQGTPTYAISLEGTVDASTTRAAPAFTKQPPDLLIGLGDSAEFLVQASGVPSPVFQWQRKPAGGGDFVDVTDGSVYSGARSAKLRVLSVSGEMDGDQFRCVAINGVAPEAVSSAGTLTVRFTSIDLASMWFPFAEGGTYAIAVTSVRDWTATSDQPWATVSPASGAGDGTVVVSVAPNPVMQTRTATITIDGRQHKLTQFWETGTETPTAIEPSSRRSPAEGETYTVAVTTSSSAGWLVDSDQYWVTASPHLLGGNGNVTVTVARNISTSERTATVRIGNQHLQVTQSGVADLAGAHALLGAGYVPGGTITITNTLTYADALSGLGWSVLLPDGWSYVSGGGAEGDVKPGVGTTSLLEWAWTSIPASPVTFTYTVSVPAGEAGAKSIAALALPRRAGTQYQRLVLPDPLVIEPVLFHSADTNRDGRLDLLELLRVVELYNTRNGTVRTGAYAVDVSNREDGFAADPTRPNTSGVTLANYHSADRDHNGKLELTELLRVIELYNYRSGTVRTGQYHVQGGSEDGFDLGS